MYISKKCPLKKGYCIFSVFGVIVQFDVFGLEIGEKGRISRWADGQLEETKKRDKEGK